MVDHRQIAMPALRATGVMLNAHRALAYCLSVIFFGKPVFGFSGSWPSEREWNE
jgi:hypothetical protein